MWAVKRNAERSQLRKSEEVSETSFEDFNQNLAESIKELADGERQRA